MDDTNADKAKALWILIERNLTDRGCFNGIDDDVMEELREDLTVLIRRYLHPLK